VKVLRKYPSIVQIEDLEKPTLRLDDLIVAATTDQNRTSPAAQLTIGDENCILAPNQARNLMRTLFYIIYGKGVGKADKDFRVVHGLESFSRKSRKMEKEMAKAQGGVMKNS
jgi:hypothetical protein